MKKHQVVVLNADLSYLNVVGWQRALKMVESGKAEVVKSGEEVITNFEKSHRFVIPHVVRLTRFIKEIFKCKVPFSKRNVKIRDEYSCQYCGKRSSKLTIDHVQPISRGGKDSWENCVACCHSCNINKGSKLIPETNMNLKSKPKAPSGFEFFAKRIEAMGISIDFEDLDWGFSVDFS